MFIGEVNPCEPVDNYMHVLSSPSETVTSTDYLAIPPKADSAGQVVPERRVGQQSCGDRGADIRFRWEMRGGYDTLGRKQACSDVQYQDRYVEPS